MKNTVLLLCIVSVTILSGVSSPNPPEQQTPIAITATPIGHFEPGNPSRKVFGELEFRGGIALASSYKNFGGISAMRLKPDGKNFIAISDHGYWLRGSIAYDGTRPAGVSNAVMAPLLDSKGKSAERWDTESIAEDGNILYIGIERRNVIMRFDYGGKGFLARAQPVPIPPGIKTLPNNKGLEAMVFVPRKFRLGGTLVAFSESGLDSAGNLRSFLIGGPSPGSFSVKRSLEFDISDAAILRDGDILLLERKFFLLEGVTIRLRKIHIADLKPGAVVDGPVLFEADSRNEIDNMEALSVHRNAAGETILTMMSDDNFSIIQRTLLLQFALAQR